MLVLPFLVALAFAEEPAPTYEYRGVAPEGRYTAEEIGAFLRQKPTAAHEVRADGWDDWRPANRVPAIVQAWLGDPVTPAPGSVEVVPAAPGDGGQAPRNAPAVEAPRAPVTVAEPEAPVASSAPPPGVRGLGELWLGVTFDPTGTDAPEGALRRLAAGLELQAGAFGARAYVGTADGGQVVLHDAWLRAESAGAVRGRGRLGVARPAFGLADRLEEGRTFWVAGASQELERTAGWFPEATLGLGGGVGGDRWDVGVEVADAAGVAPAEVVDLDAVEVRARGGGRIGGDALSLRVGASVAWRTAALGDAAPRLLAGVDAELRAGRLGLVGELVAGTEGEAGTPLVGGLALGSATIPVASDLVQQVDVVIGGGGWDPALSGLPEAEDVPDAWWEGRAGANVRWAVPGSQLITGLGYRLAVPQDIAVPLGHTLVLEAAWRY